MRAENLNTCNASRIDVARAARSYDERVVEVAEYMEGLRNIALTWATPTDNFNVA